LYARNIEDVASEVADLRCEVGYAFFPLHHTVTLRTARVVTDGIKNILSLLLAFDVADAAIPEPQSCGEAYCGSGWLISLSGQKCLFGLTAFTQISKSLFSFADFQPTHRAATIPSRASRMGVRKGGVALPSLYFSPSLMQAFDFFKR
jgi:hypothetical protein